MISNSIDECACEKLHRLSGKFKALIRESRSNRELLHLSPNAWRRDSLFRALAEMRSCTRRCQAVSNQPSRLIEIESKDEIKKRLKRSPDRADMLALLYDGVGDSLAEWNPEPLRPSKAAIMREEIRVW